MTVKDSLSPLLQRAWPQIFRDEGLRETPYQDTLGVWTVGVGHNLAKRLSNEAISQIFADDLREAESECVQFFGPYWKEFPEHVQLAVINMMFNMGATRLGEFTQTIRSLKLGHYDEAAHSAMFSKWAHQVKTRAIRVTELMKGIDVY